MLKSNLRKIMAIVLLSSFAVFCLPTASMAETKLASFDTYQETTISPRLTYIVDALAGLAINNGTATVDCWVEGQYGDATKTKVIAELQLESGTDNWIAYGTWTETQNSYKTSVYKTKSVTKGYTYRVKATVTVWEGSASEELILLKHL